MFSGIEVFVLVDPVEDIDELLEEETRDDTDPSPEIARDRMGETLDIVIVGELQETVPGIGVLEINVTDPLAHLDEGGSGEGGEAYLDRSRVVEPGVGVEIDMEALGQGREAGDSLGAFEEGGRSGDEEVEAGEATPVDLVDQLPQGVETRERRPVLPWREGHQWR